jgi:hypothetical protein
MKSSKSIFIAWLAFNLIACGGGGGGGGSPQASQLTQVVSGLAVDGYLKNATVFVDLNGNGVLDTGEPTSTTDANGAYSFSAASADVANYPVVVLAVAGTTIDQDSPNTTITQSYSMTAPIGKHGVVSPITTLVAAKVSAGQSLSVAEASVLSDLGLTNIDVYKDYVAAKQTDVNYQQVHNLAVATAEVLKSVEASSSSTVKLNEKLSSLSSKFNTNLNSNISLIKSASDTSSAKIIGSNSVTDSNAVFSNGKIFAVSPIILPSAKTYFPCTSPFASYIATADLNNDGVKDIIAHYWCSAINPPSNYTGDTPNGLVVYISQPDGTYKIGNRDIFGTSAVDLGGASRRHLTADFNNDGYPDIAFAMNKEDGRAPANGSFSNWEVKTAVIMSNGDGTYRVDKLSPAIYGHNLTAVQYDLNKFELLTGSEDMGTTNLPSSSFPAAAWRYTNGAWVRQLTYPYMTGAATLAMPANNNATATSSLLTLGLINANISIELLKKSNGSWALADSISFASSGNANVINWNGTTGTTPIVNWNNQKYLYFTFYEMCLLKINPSEKSLGVVQVSSTILPSNYSGETLNENSLIKYQPLWLFDTSNDQLSQVLNKIDGDTPNSNSYHFLCGDKNGDGYDDIFMSRDGLKPNILLNNKSGKLVAYDTSDFPSPPSFYPKNTSQSVYDDLDGDGIPDLIYFTNQPIDPSGNEVPKGLMVYKGTQKIKLP